MRKNKAMAQKKKSKEVPLKVNATFEQLMEVAVRYDKKVGKRKLKKKSAEVTG